MKKNKVNKFIQKHKTGIIITVGVIGGLVLCFFGVKFYVKRPSIEKIFKTSTLEILKAKRDEIHNEYLNYPKNDKYREELWNMLSIFDNEISKRQWNGKTPSAPTYAREHGHNLYKPD